MQRFVPIGDPFKGRHFGGQIIMILNFAGFTRYGFAGK
jgi:hypothetical protein